MFDDRRRKKRVDVGIPIRVKGLDSEGTRFEELTKSINVSSDGAYFVLKYHIKIGSLLELSLPLPRQLQKSVAPKAVYQTIGVVTRVESTERPQAYKIAVRFRAADIKQYHSES
jgi:PilZ domain